MAPRLIKEEAYDLDEILEHDLIANLNKLISLFNVTYKLIYKR
jgi:hypothetical protein